MTWKLAAGFYEDGLRNGTPSTVPVKLNPLHVYWELAYARPEKWAASGNTGFDGLGIAARRRFESVTKAVFAFIDAASPTGTYRLVRADGTPLLRVTRHTKQRFWLSRWDAF